MDGIQLQSLPVHIQVLSVKQDTNITRLIQQTETNKPPVDTATQLDESRFAASFRRPSK